MSRLSNLAFAACAAMAAAGLQAAPAHAATSAPSVNRALLVGELGIEGGPYPGGFHPTAGSVEVEFSNLPLVLLQKVGPSGHFRIPLGPGKYRVVGCGPSASATPGPRCSRPLTITLTSGEVEHIQLVWAYAP
jgi:hypothetical protein